jgi:hypothetical protein
VKRGRKSSSLMAPITVAELKRRALRSLKNCSEEGVGDQAPNSAQPGMNGAAPTGEMGEMQALHESRPLTGDGADSLALAQADEDIMAPGRKGPPALKPGDTPEQPQRPTCD